MLIALGIYCAATTVFALALLRGGSCLHEEDGVPAGECCPRCRREKRQQSARAASGRWGSASRAPAARLNRWD